MMKSKMYSSYEDFCKENKYLEKLSRTAFDSNLSQIKCIYDSRNNKGKIYKFTKEELEKHLIKKGVWTSIDDCLIEDED
eukprot:m.238744 g.238744  ORF g.238744 m.238744 type:complete len:79 (-) comp16061_c0_seq9:71-307(-)